MTRHATSAFLAQVARNLTDSTDGLLRDYIYVISAADIFTADV